MEANRSTFEASGLSSYELRPHLRQPTMQTIETALQGDATARRILAKGIKLTEGDRCGIRLNINVLRSTGVAVHSVHKGRASDGYQRNSGWWSGEVLTYAPVVVLKNAYFNVSQSARDRIACGGSKDPMASIDGNILLPDQINFDGVRVGFNPEKQHLFGDVTGLAVRFAEEVTILGHQAFCRGRIEFYTERTAPAKKGNAASSSRFL